MAQAMTSASTESELTLEVNRLKRRLERERAARREAESIAEGGRRRLYDRQQQLNLLASIASAANQANCFNDTLQCTLEFICNHTGWEVGLGYLRTGSGRSACMRPTGIWHGCDKPGYATLKEAIETTGHSRWGGLADEVMASGRPQFRNQALPLMNEAMTDAPCPLNGAAAYPMLSEGRVIGVLEFHSAGFMKPSETLSEIMPQIGAQLGRVIEREQKRAVESDLHQANAANTAKSVFLANMSHELRTPLNAIIGFSSVMRDEVVGPLDQKYREYAGDINAAGEHLLAIINDILDLSKIEAGRFELQPDVVSIADVIEDCRRIVKPKADAGHIELTLRIPEGLPLLWVDEVRVKQILLNLMSNAVKFTPSGGRVSVGASRETEGIRLLVNDSGIGMRREDIALALEPFRQIDNELSRGHDGTGLGLPLAHSLAKLHGGSLDIESAPGVGTCVTLWLPESCLNSSVNAKSA